MFFFFEIRLRMSTSWASFWSIFTYVYMTTVATLPGSFFFAGEYSSCFHFFQQTQITFFVLRLYRSNFAESSRNISKSFSFCNICKMRIRIGPLFVFACSSSFQVFGCSTYFSGRISSVNFYIATFQIAKEFFGLFFFLLSSLKKKRSILFKTAFFCLIGKLC